MLRFSRLSQGAIEQRGGNKEDIMLEDGISGIGTSGDEYGLPCILAVDDDEEVRNRLRGSLTGHYIVKAASSGEQALEMPGYGDKPGQGIEPDLIICDIELGGKINGYELYDELKSTDLNNRAWLFISHLNLEKPLYSA